MLAPVGERCFVRAKPLLEPRRLIAERRLSFHHHPCLGSLEVLTSRGSGRQGDHCHESDLEDRIRHDHKGEEAQDECCEHRAHDEHSAFFFQPFRLAPLWPFPTWHTHGCLP